MRYSVPMIFALALAGCGATAPDDSSGVGFQNYSEYLEQSARRDAELRAQRQPVQTVLPPQPSSNGSSPGTPEHSHNNAAPAPVPQQQTATPTTQQQTAPTTAPVQQPVAVIDNSGISDEQDFSAVSGRESIESDRSRIQQNRQQYQIVQPTAVPTRSGASGGPNIVEYALSTTNNVGQSVHSRSKLLADSRFNRNCAKYPSSDLAQEDFLRSGGPQRDRKGLDPDGDGFACYWDPRPFRAARRAGN